MFPHAVRDENGSPGERGHLQRSRDSVWNIFTGGKDRVISCFSSVIAQFRCLIYLHAGRVKLSKCGQLVQSYIRKRKGWVSPLKGSSLLNTTKPWQEETVSDNPQKQIPSSKLDLSPAQGECACPKGDLLRPGLGFMPLLGAPKRGRMPQGIPLPRGRTSSLEGLLQAVFTTAAQQVGEWMLIQHVQVEGLLQTEPDRDWLCFGGISSNLIIV